METKFEDIAKQSKNTAPAPEIVSLVSFLE
jgi:hypothetical protein